MSILSHISQQDFNTQQKDWENQLKSELKLDELGGKILKNTIDGGAWPTLSLKAKNPLQLSPKNSWRKASQTYASINTSTFPKDLELDLAHGVRNFFFHKKYLNENLYMALTNTLMSFSKAEEVEVFLLGEEKFSLARDSLKAVDELQMVTGRRAHDMGGSITQELGLIICELVEKVDQTGPIIYLGLFIDSQFFRNIAKIRALRLLALKVLQEMKVQKEIMVVSFTSYREWTLFERYSNMLRNDAAVASAFIGGADFAQSTGYNILFELDGKFDVIESERSKRMARNTSHILALESMLGVVQDAANGSYHLEQLTQHFAQEAWTQMQQWLSLKPSDRQSNIENEVNKVREQRLTNLRHRKHVLAGINDFPDANERLNISSVMSASCFRLAEAFEGLRLEMEKIKNRPEVYIGVFGDYAALNGRLNFVKNYFQLLGLNVHEVMTQAELATKNGIVVLCAEDELYPSLQGPELLAKERFIAGKFQMAGYINIFNGQDVYSVLEGVLKRWRTYE